MSVRGSGGPAALARTWLRRIALGLPLVSIAPVLGETGCCFGDPTQMYPSNGGSTGVGEGPPLRPSCPPDPIDVTFELTPEQQARLVLPDGGVDPTECARTCSDLQLAAGGQTRNGVDCRPTVTAEVATVACHFENFCPGGRAPAGFGALAARAGSAGEWLASSAQLEAASVLAFEDLARELALHDAPRALVEGALRAARDEARHARDVARLARRAGARISPIERAPLAPRTLRAIADENATEGCVREAYAALLAAHQATHARDREVRRTYAAIARDEARHALWSLALHEWSRAGLGARDARALEERRREALAEWAEHVSASDPAPDLRAALALPDAGRAHAIASALA